MHSYVLGDCPGPAFEGLSTQVVVSGSVPLLSVALYPDVYHCDSPVADLFDSP